MTDKSTEQAGLRGYHETAQVLEEVFSGDGEALPLAVAARRFPSGRTRTGKLHGSTLWRWTPHGVKSRSGQRVYLETVRLGCRIVTSMGALRRFVSALNDIAPVPEPEAPAGRAPAGPRAARRAREVAEARSELERRGMG